MLKIVRNKKRQNSSEHSSGDQKHSHNNEHGLLPVRLYVGIFIVLLMMIFMNIGISMLPIPSIWIVSLLIFVAIIQTILVAVFYMELIHEDKFYSFVFGSAVLFMLLFFGITLGEIRGRDFFTATEGVKMMRGVDQNGNFAPGGPKLEKKSEGSH
ncbi:hypothetical protein [Fluviispira multicolorata]|uniref:Uncharacterized protein n=1 Tax=Fluviispira multicolorata TaxID=2654512 RepID=A0A833JFF3_9BACT|nr:hypothetical protein [Fluviispira multicolorata]KAB8031000.1 hypothetical protein GCL57_08515 [Fluviispira multicolorata]